MGDAFLSCSCSNSGNFQGHRSTCTIGTLTKFLETAPWSCSSR
jgi:hypothetical protein